MIVALKEKFKSLDRHTIEVIKKSSGSLVVNVIGMLAGLYISVFLGRTLGAGGLGVINLSNQIVIILLTFAFLGFAKMIIREAAIAHDKKETKKVKDILYTAYLISGGTSILFTVTLILLSGVIANNFFHSPDLKYPLIIASLVFTPQIISRILSAALAGYKKIWQSNLNDQALSYVITAILLSIFWILNMKIDTINVSIAYAVGRLCVTLYFVVYWRHLNKEDLVYKNHKPIYVGKEMITTSLPLLIVNASLLISANIDSMMLGRLSNIKDVGLYNVGSRLAMLTGFLLTITVSAIAPKIAVLYHKKEMKELQILIQRVTGGLSIIGLVPLFIFIFFGKFILSFWGQEFTSAYPTLVIMSIGQFFNIASGPVGNILVMTNHEKIIRDITTITILINVALNFFLIKMYGATGASTATATTTILNMVACTYYVKKKTGIRLHKFL